MEKNITPKKQNGFIVCSGCHQEIPTNYVYCPYCGCLAEHSVKNALMNLREFVSKQHLTSKIPTPTNTTLTQISTVDNIADLDLKDPKIAVKFVIDYITCSIEGFSDSLNVIKELNFLDTMALVLEAKADYDRAFSDSDENTYYYRKARNNLEKFKAQISEKLPCLLRRINEIDAHRNPFKSGISISDLRAYCPIIKESICRITYSAILDISIAKSLNKPNIDYILREYQILFKLFSDSTIDLLINYDPERDHEFYQSLPQVKSDLKTLAEYTTNNTYTELTE